MAENNYKWYVLRAISGKENKVKEYIENQRTEEHKRKYVKSGRYVKKRNWRDVPGNSSPTDA